MKYLQAVYLVWIHSTRFAFFYLIGEESQPLQEVLHQLEFVSDCVFLHLSPDLLSLLGHALLQGGRDDN